MLKDALKQYFGFTTFRPGQESIISSVLEAATYTRDFTDRKW